MYTYQSNKPWFFDETGYEIKVNPPQTMNQDIINMVREKSTGKNMIHSWKTQTNQTQEHENAARKKLEKEGKVSKGDETHDHIKPLSKGGSNGKKTLELLTQNQFEKGSEIFKGTKA